MSSARLWAKRSTCTRAMNGASVVRDGRILMSGYNGAPAGLPHCNHECTCEADPVDPYADEELSIDPNTLHVTTCPANSYTGCKTAIHAEQNALNACARYGVATDGAELYCTMTPCLSCAMSIISAGITRVTYEHAYRLTEGLDLLTGARIDITKQPSPATGAQRGM